MKNLINQIFEIVKGYREGEDGEMSIDIITNWIRQFDEEDQEFLLSELLHILKLRYASKDNFKEYFKGILFKDIAKMAQSNFGLTDLKDIFGKLYFIDQQPKDKSQKNILNILGDVLREEFDLDISNCGKDNVIAVIYLDDILCTGDTLFKGLSDWLQKADFAADKNNKEFMEEKKLNVISIFYAVHNLNMYKVRSRFNREHKNIQLGFIWEDNHGIDNDYRKPQNSALQFIYPKYKAEEKLIEDCRAQIEEKVDGYCDEKRYSRTENYFYRDKNYPSKESMFTSNANRDRFEEIILKKSIELYNLADSKKVRMRPLGNGLTTDKSFGFGTLFFTWRNVPYNTPMVFWYEHKGWQPLFKRNYTEYGSASGWDDFFKELFG
ncbi:phosphoribosyltransferase-like protein [Pedobacter borealis]|uniref:phosphoribosyltransferase-like protein n=1 Tax=Pedobacter borealis TaxID=475254 RepID=UPI00049394C2|nr:hypothetical protein [Pedobacter borealis]